MTGWGLEPRLDSLVSGDPAPPCWHSAIQPALGGRCPTDHHRPQAHRKLIVAYSKPSAQRSGQAARSCAAVSPSRVKARMSVSRPAPIAPAAPMPVIRPRAASRRVSPRMRSDWEAPRYREPSIVPTSAKPSVTCEVERAAPIPKQIAVGNSNRRACARCGRPLRSLSENCLRTLRWSHTEGGPIRKRRGVRRCKTTACAASDGAPPQLPTATASARTEPERSTDRVNMSAESLARARMDARVLVLGWTSILSEPSASTWAAPALVGHGTSLVLLATPALGLLSHLDSTFLTQEECGTIRGRIDWGAMA
eukprot:scaffold189951_cov28-Tisochrysis_lutea.AAC.2